MKPGLVSAVDTGASEVVPVTVSVALFAACGFGSARSAVASARRVTPGAAATACFATCFAALPAVPTNAEELFAAVETARGRYITPVTTTTRMTAAVATMSQRTTCNGRRDTKERGEACSGSPGF